MCAHLELCGHRSVSRGDSEQEAVVLGQGGGGGDRVIGFSRGVHEGENILRESLGDSKRVYCISQWTLQKLAF